MESLILRVQLREPLRLRKKSEALPCCLQVQSSAPFAACSGLRRRLAWESTLLLGPSLSGMLPWAREPGARTWVRKSLWYSGGNWVPGRAQSAIEGCGKGHATREAAVVGECGTSRARLHAVRARGAGWRATESGQAWLSCSPQAPAPGHRAERDALVGRARLPHTRLSRVTVHGGQPDHQCVQPDRARGHRHFDPLGNLQRLGM